MTYLYNDPTQFTDELIEGYAAAYRDSIVRVDGGVIRRQKTRPGQVALIVGGGSGHFPAFGGFVGFGLAHGAAMGNVFASPSAQQICNVALAVEAGGGILFSYGNYAGDVMNFNQAQERLRAMGIQVRSVVVTDDVASANPAERHKRRGIAGTLPVFKAAAFAAELGESLDEVFRLATAANERVRTLGVAFSGCTLPGAPEPLFEVADDKMEVGMGIHGEPGLYRKDATSADGLAEMLVAALLAEIPEVVGKPEQARVGVILNSLGTVKQEELFVLYRKIDQLLMQHGLTIIEPLVGEFITSFDMAGVSLTLFWMDNELESSWVAAASSPGLRKGHVDESKLLNDSSVDTVKMTVQSEMGCGSTASQAVAEIVFEALAAASQSIDEQQETLGYLDAIAGDGDHGIGMQRGLKAAVNAATQALVAKVGVGTLLKVAGDAWSDKAGGTSGALWGTILRCIGEKLGDEVAPSAMVIAEGVANALDGITELGRAQLGDKTLVDVLHPFSTALVRAASRKLSIADAWSEATDIAEEAAQATRHLSPRIGRARPHADKSIGKPDPGAVSMALIISAVNKTIVARCYK